MKNNGGIRNFYSPARRPMIPAETQLTINVGHNGSQVVVIMSKAVKDILMTEEQAENHIKGLQESLSKLREKKAAGNAGP